MLSEFSSLKANEEHPTTVVSDDVSKIELCRESLKRVFTFPWNLLEVESGHHPHSE